MAYKRPLTSWQGILIVVLWLIALVWVLQVAELSGMTILMLIVASFLVLYPVYKSYRGGR